MLGITVFFLLVATSSFVSCQDNNDLVVKFYCDIPTASFTVQLSEEDRFSPDDGMSGKRTYSFEHSYRNVELVSFEPARDGDEIESMSYQYYLSIEHNCVKRGKKVLKAKIFLHPACRVENYCIRSYTIDLRDKRGEHNIDEHTDEWINKIRLEKI